MCLLPGVFELPQNLGFTKNQRVQSAGDAYQVSGRILAFVLIQMPVEIASGDVIDPVYLVNQSRFAGRG